MGVQLALSMRDGDPDQDSAFSSSLRTVILDCCPGDESFGAMYRATALSMPQTSTGLLLSRALLYPSLSVLNTLQRARILYGVRDLREELNDPTTFGNKASRLYIYTKEDVMVDWKAVQSHAEDARSQGYQVDEVSFQHGSHCGLIMENADQYWSVIHKAWKGEAVTTRGSSKFPSRL